MAAKQKSDKREAQNPLVLRCHRLMEAFAKSNDERDFYMDRMEGFLIYVDLDKSSEELEALERELQNHPDRYCTIPKFTFYETKKIMEGFVNEKVYDIDTKEKLLDIIQSKEARENFLEFIYDHHAELEKWQQYYQERSRIRIIEWLRQNHFHFVFEEDLDLTANTMEKLKKHIFEKSPGKDLDVARKALFTKAKTYYSNEALNPRPKRGRPPKQVQKLELEPQMTTDIFLTVPNVVRPFLFTPEISSLFDVTFSSRFESGQELMASRRQAPSTLEMPENLNHISQKLAALRQFTSNQMPEKKMPTKVEEPRFELTKEDKEIFKKLDARTSSATQAPPVSKSQPAAPKTVKKFALKTPPKKTASSKTAPEIKPEAPSKKPLRKIAPDKPSKAMLKKKAPAKKIMLRRTTAASKPKARHLTKLRKKT